MAATRQDIKDWLEDAKKHNATHVVIVCDTYDYDDYPVYVFPGEDSHKVVDNYNQKSMQKVMEVYNLSKNFEEQLAKYRNFEY